MKKLQDVLSFLKNRLYFYSKYMHGKNDQEKIIRS